jgi:hypothetical protein
MFLYKLAFRRVSYTDHTQLHIYSVSHINVSTVKPPI